jgi:glycogen debranching enzyme
VHQILDVLPAEPDHARDQLLNLLDTQQDDGYLPAQVWMRGPQPRPTAGQTCPPVWPVAVQRYVDQTGRPQLLATAYPRLVRQIEWFERRRRAEGEGFYYADILNRRWESGVDEGIRFDAAPQGALACVDATSHLYLVYEHAARWAAVLGEAPGPFQARADALRRFIQEHLFDGATGFFHDLWLVHRPSPPLAFEGMFPLVVGAAAPEQARRVIDENLLDPARFFATHPIATVGVSDPRFELRMWRGPAWNSMTYWAALGCLRYGRADAARRLVERALDASAAQFARTGTIWEFYHPHGGDPLAVARKPQTQHNTPCPDYLGHNPLLAMARLWEGG